MGDDSQNSYECRPHNGRLHKGKTSGVKKSLKPQNTRQCGCDTKNSRPKKTRSPLTTCHRDQNRGRLLEENSEDEEPNSTICPESSSYTLVDQQNGKNINKISRINRVIESGLMRERGGFSPERNPRRHDGQSIPSDSAASDHEEHFEDSELFNDSQQYIVHLKKLRWNYLTHIQEDLGRLYELEKLLDNLTTPSQALLLPKETKSIKREKKTLKNRPITRSGPIDNCW